MLMHSRSLLLAVVAASLASACVDPPYRQIQDEYPPKGVMRGTITYSGPLPCSRNGHVLGNAQVLIFNVNLLPPPDGLGLSSHRIAVIPGDVLFADVAPQIPAVPNQPDGVTACPENPPNVTVTGSWEVGPVDPGVYQARAFFDYDGDFSAAFKMANMVTKGDVGGGAIANITEVLQGGPVRYQEIPVGVPGDDGKMHIPDEGIVVSNVGVNLAAVIPTNRPYFHVSLLQNPVGEDGTVPAPIENPSIPDDPTQPDPIVVPADFHIVDANTLTVQKNIFTLSLTAGLPEPENAASQRTPFFFHTDPPELWLSAYDADHDGVVDKNDHITGSTLAHAIGPIVSLTKLDRDHDPSNLWRVSQTIPRVLSSGITTPGTLIDAVGWLYCSNWTEFSKQGAPCIPATERVNSFNAIIRPSVVCLADAADPASETVIVTPFKQDKADPPKNIINEEDTMKDIALQVRRDPNNTKIVYQCLPPGYYAINVIYTATGQAWTLPNESGICMPGETPGMVDGDPNKPTCGSRERFRSQFLYVRFGDAADPGACNAQKPAPGTPDPYRDSCLTPSERERYDAGTLWGNPNP